MYSVYTLEYIGNRFAGYKRYYREYFEISVNNIYRREGNFRSVSNICVKFAYFLEGEREK